jgi:hypothetical protein
MKRIESRDVMVSKTLCHWIFSLLDLCVPSQSGTLTEPDVFAHCSIRIGTQRLLPFVEPFDLIHQPVVSGRMVRGLAR